MDTIVSMPAHSQHQHRESDCAAPHGADHTRDARFCDPESFEADLAAAASDLTQWADELEDSTDRPRHLLPDALRSLHIAAHYLSEAAAMAERIAASREQRQAARDKIAERRTFADLFDHAGRGETPMGRTVLEARYTWMISTILDQMAAAGIVLDRRTAWPFVTTERVEALARSVALPLPSEIKAMASGALLETLHDLEARAAELRKLITLVQAMRHVRSA